MRPLHYAFTAMMLLATAALPFGGEDVKFGHPWHHDDITRRALMQEDPIYPSLGFSPEATNAIAWHADYIDSYLYNPLFWAGNGLSSQRLMAALLGFEDLSKLHFDDTFTKEGVRDNWQRYAAGTLIGLYWASQQVVNGRRGDVAAAHNVLGVSVHAVQDFYSHSAWIDEADRRCLTWHGMPPEQRNAISPFFTGVYEEPVSAGPKHHGAYSLSCSLVRGEDVDDVLEVVCAGLSPFQNTSLCEEWRVCSDSSPVTVSVLGREMDDIVRLDPPGIAMDTTWLGRVQAVNRGIVDNENTFEAGQDVVHFPRGECRRLIGIPQDSERSDICNNDADLLFAGTKDLAIRSTIDWLIWVEDAMQAQGPEMASFWEEIKAWPGAGGLERNEEVFAAQFETFNRIPYQFLSTGPYPVGNAARADNPGSAASDGYYLRVRLRTGTAIGDGTDSDIYAEVQIGSTDWQRFKLDYLPTTDATGRTDNPILVYDDFEDGDDDVYMLGPFSDPPTAIRFHNDDSDLIETLGALVEDFGNSISSGLTSLRRGALSIIAGNADYVGRKLVHLTRTEIEKTMAEKGLHNAYLDSISVDGGVQGAFTLEYRMRYVPSILTEEERDAGWLGLEILTWALTADRESDVDRWSTDDEPFFILVTSPLNGRRNQSIAYLSPIIPNMDTGDRHVLSRRTNSGNFVKLPPGSSVVLALEVYEHDDENAADREQLRQTFASGLDEETRARQAEFLHTLGRSLGADWHVNRLEVFGFYRGRIPQAGEVLNGIYIGEVEGGERSRVFGLNWNGLAALLSDDLVIDGYQSELRSPWVTDTEGQRISATHGSQIRIRVGEQIVEAEVLQCMPERQ